MPRIRYSIHNEPNQTRTPSKVIGSSSSQHDHQGWCGDIAQYKEFVRRTTDALRTAYQLFGLNREPLVSAGVLSGGSGSDRWTRTDWVNSLFTYDNKGTSSTSDDYDPNRVLDCWEGHSYNQDPTSQIAADRAIIRSKGYAHPIWWSEWAQGSYQSVSDSVKYFSKNLINMSKPGDGFVDGFNLWRLVDTGSWGLVNGTSKRPGFYAFKLLSPALLNGKEILQTSLSGSTLPHLFTRDSNGFRYLAFVNTSSSSMSLNLQLGASLPNGTYYLRQFNSSRNGENSITTVTNLFIGDGQMTLSVPAETTFLLTNNPNPFVESPSNPDPQPQPNQAPSVTITSPSSGTTTSHSSVVVAAQVSDADGSIS